MATIKDLKNEVERLNRNYCKLKKVKFDISYAYGGYEIVLKAKENKNGTLKKTRLGSGCASITDGHDTATNTLNALWKSEARGWLQNSIRFYNNEK